MSPFFHCDKIEKPLTCFVCLYVYMNEFVDIQCVPGPSGDQKSTQNPLELKNRMVVSTTWVLGSDPRSFMRTGSTLNY